MEIKEIRLPSGFTDEMKFWEKIKLLSRSKEKGFARQNGLLPQKWVELEFYGDVREIITARIEYLEEDMITLVTYPNNQLLYIDFAYKGLPKDIPLKNICFCNPPLSFTENAKIIKDNVILEEHNVNENVSKFDNKTIANQNETLIDDIFGEDSPIIEQSSKMNGDGEMEYTIPTKVTMEVYHDEQIETNINNLDTENEDNEDVDTETDIKNNMDFVIRYSVDVQVNDLLDTLVYKTPEIERNRRKMNILYKHVNRFKELREEYSTMDKNGKITGYVRHNPIIYKPMVEKLYDLSVPISWLYPVIRGDRKILNENDTIQEIMNETQLIEDLFRKEDTVNFNDVIKYKNMLNNLGKSYWKPYFNEQSTIFHHIASTIPVMRDMDVIITSNNNEYNYDLYSSSYKSSKEFGNKQYCNIQRVHGNTLYSKYVTKKNHIFEEAIESEYVDIDSVVLLPDEYIVNDGKIHVASTILEKTQYKSPYLFTILKKKNTSILNLNTDTKLSILEQQNNRPVHVIIEDDSYEGLGLFDKNIKYPMYKKLLQTIIPDIFVLIDKYEKVGLKSYSITNYMKPFLSYQIYRENLSYTSRNKIIYNVRKNMKMYKTTYDKNKPIYDHLNLFKYKNVKLLNDYYEQNYFQQNDEKYRYMHEWTKGYNIPYDKKYNLFLSRNDDLLQYMYYIDDLKFFSVIILSLNSSLISPQIIGSYIEPQHFYDIEQKTISKYYTSLIDMQNDNNNPIIKYDSKYDANQYIIMEKFKTQKSTMAPDTFYEFLKETLVSNYGCSIQNTDQLATELIQGYKIVREGDYALLEMKQSLPVGVEYCDFSEDVKNKITIESNIVKIQKYFKRVNNTWVYDKDVDSTSFAKPQDLTCKLDVANTYVANMEKMNKNIEQDYNRKKKRLDFHVQMIKQEKLIHDQYHTKLGNLSYSQDALISPNQSILDDIRSKNKYDFSNKQYEIWLFKNKYCRDPTESECQYWYYCIESEEAIQLMPRFEYELADAFKKGRYNEKLIQWKKNSKIIDGYHYDIYTGYPICEVDFSDSKMDISNIDDDMDVEVDDMDTQYEPITQNIMVISEPAQNSSYTYTELICVSIIKKIAEKIFISFSLIENQTMKLCRLFLHEDAFFQDKKKYEEQLTKLLKKQTADPKKKPLSYEDYYYDRLLIMIVCCIIITIQTEINYKFPPNPSDICIQNLDGYPLSEDIEKLGIIKYFACILCSMKDKLYPWKTIKDKSKIIMESRIKTMFQQHIILNEDVKQLIDHKRKYLALQESSDAQQNNNPIVIWGRFLPPLKPTKIINKTESVQTITKDVHERFSNMIRNANSEQWKYYGLYFGKSLLFSVSVLEMINEIVTSKQNILGNFSQFIIVENTCCNELDKPLNPTEYFQKENQNIANYYENVKTIEKVFDQIKKISQVSLLLPEKIHNADSKRVDNSVICLYNDVLIYKTFIRYFHLDSLTKPIPSFLTNYLKTKPSININSSIEEIIHYLKESEENVDLTLPKFNSILSQVNRHNVVKTNEQLDVPYNLRILNAWENMKLCIVNGDENIFENNYKDDPDDIKIYKPIETVYMLLEQYFNNGKGTADENQYLNNLENEFEKQIAYMKEQIGHILMGNKTKLFDSFDNWDDVTPISMGHMIKNYIYNMSTIIPSFLVYGRKGHENTSQWKLMKPDIENLKSFIESKYNKLSNFNDTNESEYIAFKKHIEDIQPCFKSLYDSISLFYGCFPSEKINLYKRYFKFCLYYCVFRLFQIRGTIFFTVVKEIPTDDVDKILADTSVENIDIEYHRDKIQPKLIKMVEEIFINQNIFNTYKNSFNNYNEIQENNYKIKHKEKENVMKAFLTDNKRQLNSEKAIKKLKLGIYHTNLKVIQQYGNKRDKMLFDANNTVDESSIGEENENENDENDVDESMDGFDEVNDYDNIDDENYNDDERYNDGENYNDDERYDDDDDANENGYDIRYIS